MKLQKNLSLNVDVHLALDRHRDEQAFHCLSPRFQATKPGPSSTSATPPLTTGNLVKDDLQSTTHYHTLYRPHHQTILSLEMLSQTHYTFSASILLIYLPVLTSLSITPLTCHFSVSIIDLTFHMLAVKTAVFPLCSQFS